MWLLSIIAIIAFAVAFMGGMTMLFFLILGKMGILAAVTLTALVLSFTIFVLMWLFSP